MIEKEIKFLSIANESAVIFDRLEKHKTEKRAKVCWTIARK